ncbi:tripartite tricarboxylate transporter substrate-binding protein [Teichococcus aestuarii]|uniref:tripartite tricarboxylate transporter substrate-binding protein n=1 Tax=Teichococcus aestuarii TaxID=568898 RepID=UPI00361283AB
MVGTDAGARAAPDGYTLLASTSGTHGINPSVIPNLPYDAEADFAYITTVFTVPLVIVAHPSFAPRTVAELVAAARRAPGAINYGSGGPGTSQHMAAEMFAHQAGVRLTHVPYRGSGPAVADLLAGNIPMMFDSVASALPHVQAGRIRALGVTSAARAPQLPEVPSIGETLSGYVAIGWGGLCAPAGTPEPILRRVNAEVTSLLRDPAFAARMQQMGGTPAPRRWRRPAPSSARRSPSGGRWRAPRMCGWEAEAAGARLRLSAAFRRAAAPPPSGTPRLAALRHRAGRQLQRGVQPVDHALQIRQAAGAGRLVSDAQCLGDVAAARRQGMLPQHAQIVVRRHSGSSFGFLLSRWREWDGAGAAASVRNPRNFSRFCLNLGGSITR